MLWHEVELETSDSSEVLRTKKSSSDLLVLQSLTHHEQATEVIEVGSISNNLPNRVRKMTVMTEDIRSQVQSKCELRYDTLKCCQKINLEQLDLSKGFENTAFYPTNLPLCQTNLCNHWKCLTNTGF